MLIRKTGIRGGNVKRGGALVYVYVPAITMADPTVFLDPALLNPMIFTTNEEGLLAEVPGANRDMHFPYRTAFGPLDERGFAPYYYVQSWMILRGLGYKAEYDAERQLTNVNGYNCFHYLLERPFFEEEMSFVYVPTRTTYKAGASLSLVPQISEHLTLRFKDYGPMGLVS